MFNNNLFAYSTPLIPVSSKDYTLWLASQEPQTQTWLENNNFTAKPAEYCLIANTDGSIEAVIVGYDPDDTRWMLSSMSGNLPVGDYFLQANFDSRTLQDIAVGWALGQYCYQASQQDQEYARLYVEDSDPIMTTVDAIHLVRDLINTPANLMMPEQLATATQQLAQDYNATFTEITDEEQLQQHYPAVFAVGKASAYRPRMIKLSWGEAQHPQLCLVGKGVCFDTGGLDLKPSKFMRNMKKDMGGAAHVLGLAQMIMSMKLPVRLSVLIPAVDNAISSNAFRPGDVIDTRAGKTIEIDNTDAEGRLVLCDALTEAAELEPDLIIDFATLTGAARVALGTEVPVFFTNQSHAAVALNEASTTANELIWQLPLHKPYFSQLNSDVADMTNCSQQGYGGAITAALYLNEFIPKENLWLHFDVMAWNTQKRPGRPQGGEAMGLFAVIEYLKQRYS